FLKSIITYALRPKITYAGKQIRLNKEKMNESITIVRSEQLNGTPH
ncbi:TPA: conjugal transfer protein, partial [Streptococcus agalactiae]|nr:conjugal transfer protein [Streptococcus agalactiae]